MAVMKMMVIQGTLGPISRTAPCSGDGARRLLLFNPQNHARSQLGREGGGASPGPLTPEPV